jgi:hypothetical protein
MDRLDLLRELSEKRFEYFLSTGLSPLKCRQLANEKLDQWKKLPVETLQKLLDEEDFAS